ncbi:MAG: hypothetical protein EXQ70_04415 [Solirubrobacterales bacterium]|nr:hypothetical protein [Solirubrobacterales bacterium]
MLLALAASLAIGCGGGGRDDESSTVADSANTETEPSGESGAQNQAAGGPGLEIKMGEHFFSPADSNSKAGAVTISAPNEGKLEHELVVFKSDAGPGSLPVKGEEVDEAALEKTGAKNVGEIEEVAPGETKSNGPMKPSARSPCFGLSRSRPPAPRTAPRSPRAACPSSRERTSSRTRG